MKILVTGASGMLGSDFCQVAGSTGYEVAAYSHAQMDVRQLESVREAVSLERPDCVVHTAAFTNVDESERSPELAYMVNTLGSCNVALACADAGAVMVYVSSCGVFDGKKGKPYTEFDQPSPLTHYHRSKYLGEESVARFCRRHFIVRPGWLFGGNLQHKRNFVEGRRREAMSKHEIVSANDKFGSPTYTVDFAKQVLDLIETQAFGTYHVANLGFASRYEYVMETIRCLGLPNQVTAVESDFFPRLAPVPDCEALDNMCLRMRGILIMRPWPEAMQDYVRNRLLPEIAQAETS